MAALTDALRSAIHAGDAEALAGLVAADPALVHADVDFGDGSGNAAPPLHLVCDAAFHGLLGEEQALALADVLLDSGVDPEHEFAKSGDSYLISAASLGVERVGIRLVERGADVTRRGLFRATALHWASYMGLDALVGRLVEAGSELELRDDRYRCTPLEWALHAWKSGSNGRRDGLPLVASRLVAAGASVPPEALEGEGDAMHAAIQSSSSSSSGGCERSE